jgi:hypothetical protein
MISNGPSQILKEGFISIKEAAQFQVLSFDHSLDIGRAALEPWVIDSVSDHQVVLKRDEKARRAWVTLPTGPAAKLIVDATALMTVCADNVKAAKVRHSWPQANVRSSSGHIGRDGHSPSLPGEGDDRSLLFVMPRVENLVGNISKPGAEAFGFFNACGSDQDWLPHRMNPSDLTDDRLFFLGSSFENGIRMVDTNNGTIGRDHFHVQLVDLPEFLRLSGSSSGHSANRGIERDEMLHRDGSKNSSLFLRDEILLGFDGGVETSRPSAILDDAALQLIDRLDRAIPDQIVHVASKQGMSMQGIVHRGEQGEILFVEEITAAKGALCDSDSQVGQRYISAVLIDNKFHTTSKVPGHAVYPERKRGFIGGIPGNDERVARFVDQNRIGFVNDGNEKRTMNLLIGV